MYKTNYRPQSFYNTELYHFGILGMKWGRRKDRDKHNLEYRVSRLEKRSKREKRKKFMKKISKVALVAAGVYYVKNKEKVNNFLGKNLKKSIKELESRNVKKAMNRARRKRNIQAIFG